VAQLGVDIQKPETTDPEKETSRAP